LRKFAVLFLFIPFLGLILSCEFLGEGSDYPDFEDTNFVAVSVEDERDIAQILAEQEFRAGMVRFYNREYQAAIQLYNKALSLDPRNFRARYYLGNAYLNAGYARNAIDEWENLIRLGGGNYQVKQKLNDLYFRLAIDKSYDYSDSYVLSHIYDGITDGKHKIIRPSFIAYDERSDSLYVSTAKTRYVVEVDGNGNVVRQIGRRFGDLSMFGLPTGVAIYNDHIFIADYRQDRIYIFRKNGRHIGEFGVSGYEQTNISGPMGLYISEDEYLFVVDNGNNRVQKFNLEGGWIQSVGENDLNRPTDIAGRGEVIYVSDTHNNRVVSFDYFGNIIEIIGEGILTQPRGLELKGNRLFIVDGRQGIFVYDITRRSMETLGVDEDRLQFPFGICIDSRDMIYNTDFNSQNIAVYIPLELRYANLGVSVKQVWLQSYPHNFIHLRVWDRRGDPIYDLTEENISIWEEGELIPFTRLGATHKHRDNMYIQFVVDKSLASSGYQPELVGAMRTFLENMTGNDWIELTIVDNDIVSTGRMDANVLLPINIIERDGFTGNYPRNLGTAVYDATTRLLNVNRNKAIVLFVSGETGRESFSVYDYRVLITYARENAIPVYVVSFTDKNRNIFESLAKETFGSYYTIDNLRDVLNLHGEIKNSRQLEYIINYEGLNLKGLRNFWVNGHIRIRYKTLVGVEDFGYYVPEFKLEETIDARTRERLLSEFTEKAD